MAGVWFCAKIKLKSGIPAKLYWDYEMFIFLRCSHFYGMVSTFVYLVYGSVVYPFTRSRFHVLDFGVWGGILAVTLFILIGLLQEVIIHGVAFVTIDDLLYKSFCGPPQEAGTQHQD